MIEEITHRKALVLGTHLQQEKNSPQQPMNAILLVKYIISLSIVEFGLTVSLLTKCTVFELYLIAVSSQS